jgi:CheY-like chemotaxis protein
MVLDLAMPGVDRISVLKALRAEPALRHVHTIVFTADAGAEAQVLAAGADGFLAKPATPFALLELVEQRSQAG